MMFLEGNCKKRRSWEGIVKENTAKNNNFLKEKMETASKKDDFL